jgi:hypothetical protein
MTILDRLLDELHTVKGPIRSSELASRIGISDSALDGMLDVLVAKGKLEGPAEMAEEELVACSGTACGALCVGLDKCPFIVDVPEVFSLVIEAPKGRGERPLAY